ncbi:hypothetical protein ACU81Q_05600 [Komagataeibacter melomenusus]
MNAGEMNVTGQWDGQFSYPRMLPPEFFSASLFETAGAIGGTVTERAASGEAGAECFVSTVRGVRHAGEVRFTKTYEGGPRRHVVLYAGRLSADGTEIEGTWRIEGSWSGRFLMIRKDGGAAVTVQREAVASL